MERDTNRNPASLKSMKTPSHLVLTAAFAEIFPSRRINRRALLIGAIAPDVPLMFLFVGVVLISLLIGASFHAGVDHFSELYFKDPLCISAHNILLSPVSLLIAIAFSIAVPVVEKRNKTAAISFFSGCAFHSLVDILTHHGDGPLLLWPFNWELRYSSPVSHWDPAHFGGLFLGIEMLMNLVLGYWLLTRWADVDGRRITDLLVSRARHGQSATSDVQSVGYASRQ